MIAEKKLQGITLESEFGRNYPERKLASHLIGYVGVDNTGLDGIEWSCQKELSPATIGKDITKVFGNQIFLTIDINIQYFMEKIAEQAYKDNQADSVVLLVMDTQTGDVLAYVSIPGFDPNKYHAYNKSHLINIPIRIAYEPGSVFKIFSIASFLQLGGITPYDTFLCKGYYEDTEHNIKINCLGNHGNVNAQKIIKFSCNAGAAYTSETVDSLSFYKLLCSLGFGMPTRVALSGETAGILSKPSGWSMRSKATIAFGQEISVSAMQIVAGATVFANHGLLLRPQLVKKIVSPEGKLIKKYTREPVTDVLSPEIAREMLLMMETATSENGTAKRAGIPGIRISAKTGTAEVLDPKTGTYSKNKFIASCIGIFPTDNPRLIVYVVINNPKKEYFGSKIAAPVFRKAALKLISLMDIPKDNTNIIQHTGKIRISPPKDITIGSHMPDLTGTPKRLLLSLFKRDELHITIRGEGYVIRQWPRPGTPITHGIKIILEFE